MLQSTRLTPPVLKKGFDGDELMTSKNRGLLSTIRNSAALIAVLLGMTGCSSSVITAASRSSARSLEEIAQQANSLGAAQKTFALTHHFIGVSAQSAITSLGNEGFHCSLKYKNLSILHGEIEGRRSSEMVPMIYCFKPNFQYGSEAVCPVFWAGFEINWVNAILQENLLNAELDASMVENEIYFCRITQDK